MHGFLFTQKLSSRNSDMVGKDFQILLAWKVTSFGKQAWTFFLTIFPVGPFCQELSLHNLDVVHTFPARFFVSLPAIQAQKPKWKYQEWEFMIILWNNQRHTWHQTVWNIKFPHFLFIRWKENRSGRGSKWFGMVKALYHSTVLNLYRNASLHVQRESYQQKLETNQDIEEIPASSYKISREALHLYLDVSGLHRSTTEHSL